jgi:hypothetical protein
VFIYNPNKPFYCDEVAHFDNKNEESSLDIEFVVENSVPIMVATFREQFLKKFLCIDDAELMSRRYEYDLKFRLMLQDSHTITPTDLNRISNDLKTLYVYYASI